MGYGEQSESLYFRSTWETSLTSEHLEHCAKGRLVSKRERIECDYPWWYNALKDINDRHVSAACLPFFLLFSVIYSFVAPCPRDSGHSCNHIGEMRIESDPVTHTPGVFRCKPQGNQFHVSDCSCRSHNKMVRALYKLPLRGTLTPSRAALSVNQLTLSPAPSLTRPQGRARPSSVSKMLLKISFLPAPVATKAIFAP